MRKSGIAALTAGVILALVALRGADLWVWRGQILSTAEARAANLSFILSEYIRESFAASDASLRQLVIHSRRVGGPLAPESDWGPILASARAGLRELGSISVTDASGTIVHSTQPVIVGQSRAAQFLFRQLAGAAVEPVVDTPYAAVVAPGGFVIPLGRRLTSPSGQFAGTVVASFVPEMLREFFRTVDVGGQGVIWVFHPAGQLVIREPSTLDPIGTAAAGNPVFEAARAGGARGLHAGPLEAGGPSYLTAFHATSAPPLYIAVSLDRAEVLADWRRQAWTLLVITLVVGATTLVILILLFRQMDARAAALASALEAEQRARRASEDASRQKEEFLMTVSHELRTPLQSILGWSRVLMAGGVSDPATTATALETIERNVGAQTTLIEDLLDVSRGIGGSLRLDLEPVDLAQILGHVVDGSSPHAAAKSDALTATIARVPAVLGDVQRLRQVFRNLVTNGIKFTPEGGEVRVRLGRVGDAAETVISDTGAGIDPEFLPHVFERFRQADSSTTRRYGGLGLGLAIVRQLVELHGGTVTAESAGAGRGATFRVRLPIAAAPTYTERRDDGSRPARA